MNYPVWQDKYIDLVHESFDRLNLTINDKELNQKVAKFGEMKKAMPFVQILKKRLIQTKENPDSVFDRKLPFDELDVLRHIVKILINVTGAKEIEVIAVEEGGKVGTNLAGEKKENLPPSAANAVPGQPTFNFENLPDNA